MNINKLPGQVRDDIEMQSLLILKHIAEDIVVIGGWAVRALLIQNLINYY